jgi:N-acetylglucosaminyldiphosphoundecaprenol N-acetyl-beta-D-mannosaminyltransferase
MRRVFDATQRYRLNHLDMVVPDAQPVIWAMNLLCHTGSGRPAYTARH